MRVPIASIIFLIILLAFLVSALRKVFEYGLFKHRREHVYTPTRRHLDLFLDGMHVWHFNDFSQRPIILYCHGTGVNISHYKSMIKLTERLHLNLIIFDYHGYGQSEGVASPVRLYRDTHTIYNYVRQHYAADDIVVWGESMGGAPAVKIAQESCRALIIMATFASLTHMSKDDKHTWPVRIMGKTLNYIDFELPNIEEIKNVHVPITIIHSVDDDIIPYCHAGLLYDAVVHDNKILLSIAGRHSRPQLKEEDIIATMRQCNISVPGVSYVDILDSIHRHGPLGISSSS